MAMPAAASKRHSRHGRRSCCVRSGRRPQTRYLVSLKQLAPWLDRRALSDIDGRLVAEIIRERQHAGVTNATIKRDLGALSSVLNFAILQGWTEANPVLAKLVLVPERRDPILLPTDRDIALVLERAPGMVGQMMRAALVDRSTRGRAGEGEAGRHRPHAQADDDCRQTQQAARDRSRAVRGA